MKVQNSRRRKHKTNYNKRITLLKSKDPRIVIRKTNRYVILQLVQSKEAQDNIVASVNTKDLLKLGWPENKSNSLKSLSAGYLAGYLLGTKLKGKVSEAILDSGLIPSTKGSKVYAAVKGIFDAGIKISHNEKILPSEDQINNAIGKENITKIKENIQNG